MNDLLNGKVGGFISRHGFGIFVAVVLMGEVLGLNPYSHVRIALQQMEATAGEVAKHDKTAQEANAILRDIRDNLVEQRKQQAQERLVACLRLAKNDREREECAKLIGR